MKIININRQLVTPLYKQIAESIETAIIVKRLFRNDKLPSVNKICMEYNISRDTVFMAYESLKKKGIIKAIPSKGYYVRTEDFSYTKRYFFLLDELNIFKEDLLNSFLEGLHKKVQVDTFFHHFDLGMFRKLILDNIGNYCKYIILPGNLEGVEEIIHQLPQEDVYILDQMRESLQKYSGIYQNFVEDIFNALESSLLVLEKYQHYILIFPGNKEPIDMINGFVKFCKTYNKKHSIIPGLEKHMLKKGQVFLIPNDRQLVETVEQCRAKQLKIGKDIGIISYNETPLKKVVENGITTLSTDFSAMGKRLSEIVLKNEKILIPNPSKLHLRGSL